MMMVAGSNSSDISEKNRSAVLRILQQGEDCSRADIARKTGLTQAAITKIVAGLIDMGIVSETGFIKNHRQRRSVGLRLNAGRYQIIGAKFMRGTIALGVFDIAGKVYTQETWPFSLDEQPPLVLAEMKARIRQLLEKHPRVMAIGLALPGPYLRQQGRIAVITRMPAWQQINFIEEMQGEFDRPVFIEHDANAGAMAEYLFGSHQQMPHTLAYLLVGEGVGAGVVEQGSLILGHQGGACEIGHISVDIAGPPCDCGNHGCLENHCSAAALVRLAREQAPGCFVEGQEATCEAVFQAARQGKAQALAVVQTVARYIGYGCVNLINAYNPSHIVIGDVVAQGGDLLLPTIQAVVKERVVADLFDAVTIRISTLPVDPTLYGAAAAATNKALQEPSLMLKAH